MNLNQLTSYITGRVLCEALHPMIRRSIAARQPHYSNYNVNNGPAYDAHPRAFWGCANALEYGVCCATEEHKYATGWAIPDSDQGMHGDYVNAPGSNLGARDAEDLMSWFNMRVRNALAFY